VSFAQRFTGKSSYYPDYRKGQHVLVVSVTCSGENLAGPFRALLDTASQWCVLSPQTAENLGLPMEPDALLLPLMTRFGRIQGRLERLQTTLVAEEGDDLEFEATWFVSEDWPGPMVIGWKGGLERFRFALNPGEEIFYFGAL